MMRPCPARPAVRVEPMEPTDWPAVHRIYADGIATGDATLEREAPDWDHFDRSHRHDCRLVARLEHRRTGRRLGRPDGLLGASCLQWRGLGERLRRRGRIVARASGGHCSQALVPGVGAAGFWTLLAGVMVENEASLALHERCGFERVGMMRAMGRDAAGRWRDVVLMQRRSRRVGV